MDKVHKKGKILQVSCNGLTNGGVQQVIMTIVSNLSDKYTFDVVCFLEGPEFYDKKFKSYGGKIFRIPNKKHEKFGNRDVDVYFRQFRIIRGVYRILKDNGPYKAIHCHNYQESALCLIAAKLAGVKIRIVHSHNDMTSVNYSKSRKILFNVYKKILNRLVTKRVACSQPAAEYLFGENKAEIIFNAIDMNKFSPEKYLPVEPHSELRILHVGISCGQKNQKFIIKVLEKLKKRGVNFHMTFIGSALAPNEPDYLNELKHLADETGLTQNITFLPHDSDVPEYMHKSDCFIFPSKFEGLGIVVVEAQAMGLHCIVSTAVPKEADLGNVEYIEGYNADEWAEALKKSEKRFVDMSAYSIQNVLKKYVNLYDKGGAE